MKRLTNKNINTPELSTKIFKERWHSLPHYIDWERFKRLAKFFTGGVYVDLGCFNSPMPYELKQNFPKAEVFAIDHASEVIETMNRLLPGPNYICADLLKADLDKEVDYIVCGETIEHLHDTQWFINKHMRFLKKGGCFAISTPNNEMTEHPYDDYEHLWGFTEGDVRGLLKSYGEVQTEIFEGCILAWCYKV